MTFEELLDQVLDMLQRRGRVSYRAMQRQFDLDDATLEDVKAELLYAHPELVTDEGRGLVWTGAAGPTHMPTASPPEATPPAAAPVPGQGRQPDPVPRAYTPTHLTEKFSPPVRPWQASANRSRCSLPTSRTRHASSRASIQRPRSAFWTRPSTL